MDLGVVRGFETTCNGLLIQRENAVGACVFRLRA
jgi:hypothetical protein